MLIMFPIMTYVDARRDINNQRQLEFVSHDFASQANELALMTNQLN
jgi:hypothetical protein